MKEEEPETVKPETNGAALETEASAVGTKPQMQTTQMTESTSSEAEVLDLEKSGDVAIKDFEILEYESKRTAEVTVASEGTSDYTEKLHDFWVRISGYFNKDTGEISLYMIFWHHIVHTKHQYLFPFLFCS